MAKVFNIGGNTISYGGFLLRELGNGSLTITKSVSGSGFDPTKTFEIVATFSAPVTYNGTTSTTHVFNLAHGQSVTITGIPELTEYTISENIPAADVARGYSLGEITNGSGSIPYEDVVVASVANTYTSVLSSGQTLRFLFDNSSFDPTAVGINWNNPFGATVQWAQVSSSPNVWDATVIKIERPDTIEVDWRQTFMNKLDVSNDTYHIIATGELQINELSHAFSGAEYLQSSVDWYMPRYGYLSRSSGVFKDCIRLENAPYVLGAGPSVNGLQGLFKGCSSLQSVGSYKVSQVGTGAFEDCTSLTEIPASFYTLPAGTSKYSVDTMFKGCINISSGIYDAYDYWRKQYVNVLYPPSSEPRITSHSETFASCGINTQQGAAELAQIPSDWK